MRVSRHGLLLPAASMLLGCVSAAVPDEPRVVVAYADLDLSAPADRRELSRRVRAASLHYCRERATLRRLPPHVARAQPAECLNPARRAIIDAAPAAVRAALR